MLPDFGRGNLATTPNTLGKHRSRPHPFQNQTLKPNSFKVPKVNANSLIFNCQCPSIKILPKERTIYRQVLWGA